MPITSLDLPEESMKYISSLTQSGKVKTFKSLVLELLEFHKRFSMGEWTDNIFYSNGLRHAFFSQNSLNILVQNMKAEDQYEAGKRMGKTWIDACFARFGGPISKDKWSQALGLLDETGCGKFEVIGKTIIVKRPFLPLPVLHGYLETGLGVKLERLSTTEQIGVFRISDSS
ncbi:MAG: hypothetical protein NWF14_01755 [Candidatus Bathyarchaeota archaeon]|nr:hypothetical protein [Candidatus Bathyarchaeota archaeon]